MGALALSRTVTPTAATSWAVLGYKETWVLIDVLKALIRTPMNRWNLELHGSEQEPER
jgi:hypothetical protein